MTPFPADLRQIQAMQPPAGRQVSFTFVDVTVHTLATWALASILVSAYWVAEFTATGSGANYLGAFIAAGILAVFVFAWFGSPLAWLTGLALRNVAQRWVHVVVFGALGAVASVPVMWLMIPWTGLDGEPRLEYRILGVAVLAGLFAAAGRALAFAARARREQRPPRPADPEDVILDALESGR